MENKPKSKMNKSLLYLGIGLFIIGLLLILTIVFSDTEKSVNYADLYLGVAFLAVGSLMAVWQIRKRMSEKSDSENQRWR